MLSRRNYQEKLRKMEPKKERFSIRKFTVGAASVLIGFTFMGMASQTVKADTTNDGLVNGEPTEKTNKQQASADVNKTKSGLNIVKSSETVDANEKPTPKSAATDNEVASNQTKSSQDKAGKSDVNTNPVKSKALEVKTSATSKEEANTNKEVKDAAKAEKAAETKTPVTLADIQKQVSDFQKNAKSMTDAERQAASDKIAEAAAKLDSTEQAKLANEINANMMLLAESNEQSVAEVSNWDQFAAALAKKGITTIKLKGNITVTGASGSNISASQPVMNKSNLILKGDNIARAVTIDGQSQYKIDFGKYALQFTDQNQGSDGAWTITLKNVGLDATPVSNPGLSQESPLYFGPNTANVAAGSLSSENNAKNTVIFDGVTANVVGRSVISASSQTQTQMGGPAADARMHIIFRGNNNITDTIDQSGISANARYAYQSTFNVGRVTVESGTTTINTSTCKTNNDMNPGNNAIRAALADSEDGQPSVEIKQGATLNINGKDNAETGGTGTDVRGIVTSDAKTGTVKVDGTLNENLSNGHSNAIVAGNLNIGKTGKVNIITAQDNQADGHEYSNTNGVTNYNGVHYAVIALGVGATGNLANADSNSLTDNGSLTIKRTVNNQYNNGSNTGLIAFGSGSGAGIGQNGTFALTVGEGASLDLQDNASDTITSEIKRNGLISMFGSGDTNAKTSNTITLDKPALFNLQRTGSTSGRLIRLENMNNHFYINGINGGTPVSQWSAGNYTDIPNYSWRVTDMNAQNNWGNNSISGFTQAGKTEGQNATGTIFLNSNGTVKLSMDKVGNILYKYENGTQTPASNGKPIDQMIFNQFLNSYNPWTAQRLSIGSNAIVITPAYAPTTVKQGDTKAVMPVIPADGATSGENADQVKVQYSAETGEDATPDWVTVDPSTGKLTLAPTTDTDKGMYNVAVHAKYIDESTGNTVIADKTVYAPVYVTDGNETVTWGKDPNGNYTGAIVVTTDPAALKAHETTANSSVLEPKAAITSIDEYVMSSNHIETTPISIDKDSTDITTSWDGTTPTTVVTTPSNSEELNGTVKVVFGANSKPVADGILSGNETTSLSDITIPAAGATAKTPATPVTVEAGSTALREANFDALIDHSALDNAGIDYTYAWKTAPKAGDTSGVVRITFTDKDAQGNNTYLDIPTSANSIKVHSNQTDADKNNPEGQTINVDENHILNSTDASNAIKNKGDLTNLSTTTNPYTWDPAATPSTTTPGDKAGTVIVTYADGSQDKVPVIVHVKSQAETYTPEGQDVHTDVNGTPAAEDGISNKTTLPEGTKYAWTTTPDTSKPAVIEDNVKVTYPDGSVDEVPVHVIVGNPTTPATPTDADKNNPTGKEVNTTIGVVPDPSTTISWPNGQPTGGTPTYTWSGTPDVYTKGPHTGIVKVTYGDGSVDYVPTTVNVTNEPSGKPTTIAQGGQVPDPSTTVDWGNGTEPTGTTITWEKQPDPSQPGTQQGTVKITYPNGETTSVVVPVTVTPSSTPEDYFNPTAKILHLGYGADVPAAKDVIDPNSLGGFTVADGGYKWTVEPDTKQPGLQLAHISVTGTKNGKTVTKDVLVYAYVGTEAEAYSPKGQNFSTPLNSNPAATQGISNIPELPSDAKITWALAPYTKTSGHKASLIKVTYGDGSVDYVPVDVNVENKLSNEYPVHYNGISLDTTNGTATDSVPPVKTQNTPANAITGYAEGTFTAPEGITISVDKTTGKVTATATKDANKGTFNVPVLVTYSDGTAQDPDVATVYVPVSVIGTNDDHDHPTYYGNQSSTGFTGDPINTHKTTDGSVVTMPPKFGEIVHNYNWDGTNGNGGYYTTDTYKLSKDGKFYYLAEHKNNKPGTPSVDEHYTEANTTYKYSSDAITMGWQEGFKLNTNVDQWNNNTETLKYVPGGDNSAEQTKPGQSLPGNSLWRATFSVGGEFGVEIGVIPSTMNDPYTMWVNQYANLYGAKQANTPTYKQNQDISGLSQDQFRNIINVTDLGQAGWNGQNINPNAPQVLAYINGTDNSKKFSMSWAPDGQPSTAEVANGVQGVVRIHFNDGTYLDVPANINVVADPNSGKQDDQKTSFTQKIVYQYNGQQVASTEITDITKGSSLSADQLKNTIDGNVPGNYSIADGYTYPAPENNIIKTPADIIVPLKQSEQQNHDSNYDAQYTISYKDAKTGAALQTKGGQNNVEYKFNTNDGLSAATIKAGIDNNIPTGWKIADGFTYPASQTKTGSVVVPLVHATKDITPTDPTVNPTDPKYKAMFSDPTRTINVHETDENSAVTHTEKQTVWFGREGVLDEVTGKVTAKEGAEWKLGKIENGKFVEDDNATDSWAEYTAPAKQGYTAVGSPVAAQTGITANTADTTVDITYTDGEPFNFDPTNKDEVKDVTRTITVYKTDGTTQTIKQTVHFVRGGTGKVAGYKDSQGNIITWTPWTVAKTVNGDPNVSTGKTNGSWAEFDVPQVTDYTSTVDGRNATKVDEQGVNAETPDAKVVVAYTTTKNPTDPGINPNDPGKDSDMFANPTRTINVIDPDGTHEAPVIQTVWFGRTKTVSTDPNAKPTYGDWKLGKVENNKFVEDADATDKWDEYTAPAKSGYTAINSPVAEKDGITASTENVTITITYTSNGGGDVTPPETNDGTITIIYKDKDGKIVKKLKPVSGPVNTSYPSYKEAIIEGVPSGYHLADDFTMPTSLLFREGSYEFPVSVVQDESNNKKDDETPVVPDKDTKPGNHGNGDNTEITGSRGQINPNGYGKNNGYGYGNGYGNGAARNRKTLPQTGADQNLSAMLGIMIAGIGLTLGLAVDKKRKF